MSLKTDITAELNDLLQASFQSLADKTLFTGRPYEQVKEDYDAICLHADEKSLGFDKAAAELNLKFTPADKWVMVKHGLEEAGFTININEVCRGLRFKYTNVEKRVRILLLLREEAYENGNPGATLPQVLEKWRFSMSMLDPMLKMFTYLSVLITEGNEVEARNMAGYVSGLNIDAWKAVPEFKQVYLEALDRTQHRLIARLQNIANSSASDASSVQAIKMLLERTERQRLGELYENLDVEGRKRELRKRAFILAAEKGANLKEALKLEDPDEFGGLDDVNVLLPDGFAEKITPDAPTHLLLQMQQLLEQYSNNSNGQ
ncbi:hypothetical protein C7N43_38415 [Sphingobacteriales bacterium UPWRP_1]|nr:hypothetical protein C7N43_38415 [Sphingobacteriales bacterium UPWRP_1]